MPPEPSDNLVDTHCHLNFDVFDDDRNLVIDNARRNGVSRILIPGIDIETSKSAIEIANHYSEVYASIGIHPNQGLTWKDDSLIELINLASNEKVIAIGEIGLDYYRDYTPMQIQHSILRQQLELAAELDLPVILHNRNSSEDILNILHQWHQTISKSGLKLSSNPGVMHSFSGDKILANELIAMNFKIGINGPVTFHNFQDLQSTVVEIASENILIETDAPFLTPHPHRGKRNEPANVRIVAGKIAELKGIALENIAKITTTQADKLFRWRENN